MRRDATSKSASAAPQNDAICTNGQLSFRRTNDDEPTAETVSSRVQMCGGGGRALGHVPKAFCAMATMRFAVLAGIAVFDG
jgi:hypothetical protein